MKNFQILIAEDDRSIMNLIMTTLKINGYSYICAGSGNAAITQCASHNPDLILLDLGLPDLDGIEVIARIRTWSQIPIIVISARDEDADKILALDTGADDYLTKPFSVDEMMARIRACQRRLAFVRTSEEETVFVNGTLAIDYASGIVTLEGQEIHLTALEYKILCLLARNAGKVLTHSYIIDQIWGNGVESDIVSLRVYMTALRKKLRLKGDGEQLIETRIGIGYRMIRF